MLVKQIYPDVDNLRSRDLNFNMDCRIPKRPKRNLPTLPEDKEYNSIDIRTKVVIKKRRQRRQIRLPVLPESDEN